MPKKLASVASGEEAKTICELLKTNQTKEVTDVMDQLFEKHDLQHSLRVATCAVRFTHNCWGRKKCSGILTKDKIDDVKQRWISLVQQRDRQWPHCE